MSDDEQRAMRDLLEEAYALFCESAERYLTQEERRKRFEKLTGIPDED